MSAKHRRKPYMPDSDSGKAMWMERFIAKLETDPKHYGFDDERMFEYTQRTIRTFIDAAKEAANKGARSTSTVVTKNQARAEAVAMCRSIAMRLKIDPNLSDEEKISLGIHTTSAEPETAQLPQGYIAGTLGYPTLNVLNSPNGGHVISYRDQFADSKGKPKGVTHLLLFAAIGEKPKMSRTHARLLGAYSNCPFEILYPMGCGVEGSYVTYYGRWLTTRGQMSPFSPGISKVIGDTRARLRDTDFSHIFGKEGFIDALPEGVGREIVEDRPLLDSEECGRDGGGFFEVMEPKMLPLSAFALLEMGTKMPVRGEE